MTVRDELHEFADAVPKPAAEALLEYARWLAVHEGAKLSEGAPIHRRESAPAPASEDSLEALVRELLGDGRAPDPHTGA